MTATISASRTTPAIDNPTARPTVFNDDAAVSPSKRKLQHSVKRGNVIIIAQQKSKV